MGLGSAINLIKKGAARGRELGFRTALAYGVRRVHDSPQRMEQAVFQAYSSADLDRQREHVFPREIKFSILVPLYHTPIPFLEEMIQSVQAQTYSNWELCLADGSDSSHPEVEDCALRYVQSDDRIRYQKLEKNEGISGNSNACLAMATGDYIGLLDHDDLLHPAALYEVMNTICQTQAEFIYTDEATFQSPNVKDIVSIHFKPDYAPDQLKANNYICHFSVFSRALLEDGPLFRREYDGSQDHDLILRLTKRANRVVHIPHVLYLWRSHPQSVAMNLGAKSYAVSAGIRAVETAAAADGYPAKAASIPASGSVYRLSYALASEPMVSVIIPQCRQGTDAVAAAKYLLAHTDYPNVEILLVGDCGGADVPGVSQIPQKITSYGEGCRIGAEHATGAYLLFVDSSLRPKDAAWLTEMMMYAQRSDVGAVGAMQTSKKKLIHTGYVLGFEQDDFVGCPYQGFPQNFGGYMHCLSYARDVSAVSGACLLMKKADYAKVGGVDPELDRGLWDVDLCLSLGKQGLYQIWTPYAVVDRLKKEKNTSIHQEKAYFLQKWQNAVEQGDPYYNPNFSHRWGGFLIEKK